MDVDSVVKYNDLAKLREANVHFTIIFNVFVIMTLCNEINARKLHEERNFFDGIQNNYIFIGIWIGCFIGQVILLYSYFNLVIYKPIRQPTGRRQKFIFNKLSSNILLGLSCF